MNISYITIYNASDIHNWSGTGFSIAKMLEDHNARLEYISDLRTNFPAYHRIKLITYKLLSNKTYLFDRDIKVVQAYAKQIKLRIKENTDIIFSPGSMPIALLESKKPKVFYTDANFAGMLGFYDCFSNLCSETVKNGHYLEQKALESSQLVLYASDWAAKTAIENYNINPSKIRVVPFGANISSTRKIEDIKTIINKRSDKALNLLFVGIDWKRKGGNFALSVAKELNHMGLKTTLHIVGVENLPFDDIPDFVVNHGFISKTTAEGMKRINDIFAQSHFLIGPSIAEAYGLVFCEANSYGLPSLATNVGGIPTIIKDDINGKTFTLNADVREWCEFISNYYLDKPKYYNLCMSSFDEYETRLNWKVAGESIMKLLKEL